MAQAQGGGAVYSGGDRDAAALAALMQALSGADRKSRQSAASMVAQVARSAPGAVAPYAPQLVEAAARPEAQTRWEAFDALSAVARVDPEAASQALDAAEDSLYDEDSATVRLAAFRYLAAVGSISPEWSRKVWPFIDDAVQCYHGDPGFDDMLSALASFARSDLDPGVREALAGRMAFDASSGKGAVAARARQIVSLLGR